MRPLKNIHTASDKPIKHINSTLGTHEMLLLMKGNMAQKQEGKVDVLSRDSRKDCEGQSEISRFLCDFTKSKWIM